MTRAATLIAMMLSLLIAATAGAASLPGAKPEEVGLASARLERIGHTLREDVERGRIPGAVVLIARKGRVAYLEAIGFRDKTAGVPMKTDDIFRLASMTKPMASVAAMILYEEGKLLLSDPVSKYLPALGKRTVGVERVPAQREMTVQDLLRHTSGLPYGGRGQTALHKMYPAGSGSLRDLTGTEFIDRLAALPLLHHPGTAWEYGFSTDVLGRVVEAVSGKSLGQFLDERVFRPLKMADTGFMVPKDKHARIAQPFAKDPDTGKDISIPDARVAPKLECGGACAVSTAADYARFSQMLLNRGALDGVRILAPKTVDYMTADHLGPAVGPGTDYLPGDGYGFGLGFAVRRATGVANGNGSAGDYNWGGAYGTYFWVDPKEQLVVVSMTQAPGPIRLHYRQLLKSLVLQAVTE